VLFGTEWAVEHLLPPIVQIREHESYLRRLTALKACSIMATVMDADTVRLEVLPIILDMAADVVRLMHFTVVCVCIRVYRLTSFTLIIIFVYTGPEYSI
jgi:serine/threonine-protein phosphatase 2A regulatory subunit A